jgi:TRAP transporter TAXI family solute receptor
MRIRTIAALAAAALFAAAPAKAETFLNILTGGTSGVYYPLGVALSQIFTDNVPESRPSVQATKASVENLNLLQDGKGEIAFTLGDSLALAAAGNADAGFPAPLDKLRTIAAIYPNYIQIVASQESGIKTLADLKGKRISVGAPKSGTELNARAILAAAGMSYEDLGQVEYLPFAESVELMKNRQLDATLQSAGLGVASIATCRLRCRLRLSRSPPTWSPKRALLTLRRQSRRAPMTGRRRTCSPRRWSITW